MMLYLETPQSSVLKSMYFGNRHTFVYFRDGAVYKYDALPHLEDDADNATSKGAFFVRYIRNLPSERIK